MVRIIAVRFGCNALWAAVVDLIGVLATRLSAALSFPHGSRTHLDRRSGRWPRGGHDNFVQWLQSDAGARMLRQYRLNRYEMRQSGNKLAITMQAEEPAIIIHFLRNHAAWPAFWSFDPIRSADAPPDATLRFEWKKQ